MPVKWEKVKGHANIYVYKTQRGKRYGVRRGFKNNQGKYDEFSPSGFTNWRDADAALKKFEAELVTGKLGPLSNRSVTVNQYYESMKKRKIELKIWRPSTVLGADQYYNNHIKSVYGTRSLSDISRSEYQAFIDGKVTKGYAETTLTTINSIMQQIMNDAARNDIIFKNKLSGITIDGAKQQKSQDLSEREYAKFMTTAKEVLTRYRMGMLYLISLGDRREEAAGLQLKSFVKGEDEEGPYYVIHYYVGRTQAEPNGGPLKNDGSYRDNIVHGKIVEYIDYMIEYCKEICKRTHREINGDTFIYLNEKTGMPPYPNNINRNIFGVVSQASGVKVHPHLLRHYFATMSLANGTPDVLVAKWLGHKNVSMSKAYARPTDTQIKHVGNSMKDVLF